MADTTRSSIVEDVARRVRPRLWRGRKADPICAPDSPLDKSLEASREHIRAILAGPVGDVLRELIAAEDSENRGMGDASISHLRRASRAVHALPSDLTDMLGGKS